MRKTIFIVLLTMLSLVNSVAAQEEIPDNRGFRR